MALSSTTKFWLYITLFSTFLLVYFATAVVTIYGVLNKGSVDYMDVLVPAVLVETVVAIIAVFKTLSGDLAGGDEQKNKMNVVMLPPGDFQRSSDPHRCEITILDSETGEQTCKETNTVRSAGYLSTFIDGLKAEDLIQVRVVNKADEQWESDYFSPALTKAELVKIE